MAKKLVCSETGMTAGCPFAVIAETDDETLRHAKDHAQKVHNMPDTPELENNFKKIIKNA